MYALSKRILDVILSLFLALLFFPIWIIVPFLVYLDSPGPIIYRHRRVGKAGHEFWLYKFRTMVKEADDILYKHNKSLLVKFKKSDWKLKNDPRITRFGRIPRALTIDEFPQLYNVLKGEMSLVGPRAYVKQELVEQQHRYPHTRALIKKILSVKPGITGPWQVSGRNEVPFDHRARLDAIYAQKRSLLTDLVILFKTPKAMISKW